MDLVDGDNCPGKEWVADEVSGAEGAECREEARGRRFKVRNREEEADYGN